MLRIYCVQSEISVKYSTGEEICLNDHVLIEHRRTSGVVEHIIETEAQMREWNLDEQGVLIKSPAFGRVFWSIKHDNDPVIFLSRGKQQ